MNVGQSAKNNMMIGAAQMAAILKANKTKKSKTTSVVRRNPPINNGDAPLCKNCKHIRPDTKWWVLLVPIVGWIVYFLLFFHRYEFAKCARKQVNDLITGRKTEIDSDYCSVDRKFQCGPSGKFFEQK